MTDTETTENPATSAPTDFASAAYFEGTELVVTDKVLLARLDRQYWSPSSSKSLSKCPASWVISRSVGEAEDPFDPAPVGTAVHRVLEVLYGLPVAQRTQERAAKIVSTLDVDHADHVLVPTDVSELIRWKALVLERTLPIFNAEDPTTIQVAGLERQVIAEIDGVPFLGNIDRTRILLDDNGFPCGTAVDDYKGLALDTPIPTPDGWTTMGALEVGDSVLGANGKATAVTVKSPVYNRNCYRITFSDGSSVVCDNVHLWQVTEARGNAGKPVFHEEIDADALYALFTECIATGRRHSLTVANPSALDLPARSLPVDPYILGAWLGDGASAGGVIFAGAQDAAEMEAILRDRWGSSVHETVRTNSNGNPFHHFRLGHTTRAETVTIPADPSRCKHGVLLGATKNECCKPLTPSRMRQGPVSVLHAIFGEPTNVKPDPDACPFGHSKDGTRKGKRCKTCRAMDERIRRGTEVESRVRTNVKPDPNACAWGHPLHRVRSGDLACSTCINAQSKHGYRVERGEPRLRLPVVNVPRARKLRAHRSLATQLSKMGVLHNKHIPVEYLRGSVEDRLDLLRGLMDTDGSWNATRNRAVFSASRPALAHQVAEAVASLGVTPQVSHISYNGFDSMQVEFAPVGFNPFLMGRKASKVTQPSTSIRALRRYIASMEPVESVPTQCITVDSADALYLAGPLLVPTHNSSAKGAKSDFMRRQYGDDHGDQGRLYALALENLDGRMPDKVSMVYTATGEVYDVPLDTRSLNKTRKEFTTSYAEMKASAGSGRYRTGASPLCGWCPVATVCPAAAKAGKNTPKVDRALLGEQLGIRTVGVPGTVPVPTSEETSAPDMDMTHSFENDTTITEPQEGQMSTTQYQIVEDKTWEESPDGVRLNGNSYAATAAFGTATLAHDILIKNGQAVNATNVPALAATLASIVATVQVEFSGQSSMMNGFNTRLRATIYSAMKAYPAPFGGDEAAWDLWVANMTKRVRSLTRVAFTLWANGPGERPWEVLVGTTQAVPVSDAA